MDDVVDVPCILHFDASEEAMTERIMERSKTSGRADDNLESLKKRFDNFRTEQLPVIGQFAAQGKAKKINGLQEVDKVHEEVKIAMADYL